jgi:MFS family permease
MGCFIFSIGTDFHLLVIARLTMGIGAAFSLLSSLKYARENFQDQMALFSAVALSMGMLGGMFAKTPTYFLLKIVGQMSGVFIAYAVIAIVLAIVMFIFMEHESADKVQFKPKEALNILTHKNFWRIALYGSLMYSPFLVMEIAWSENYLGLLLPKLSDLMINAIESLVFLGMIVGSMLLGYMSDHSRNRQDGLFYSAIAVSVVLVGLFYIIPPGQTIICILLFLFGFFTGGFMPSFAYLLQRYPMALSGTVLGMMNCINMLGATITTPVMGGALDALRANTEMDLLLCYQLVFIILPIFTLVAATLIRQVKD